jgi:hypothetical protein
MVMKVLWREKQNPVERRSFTLCQYTISKQQNDDDDDHHHHGTTQNEPIERVR